MSADAKDQDSESVNPYLVADLPVRLSVDDIEPFPDAQGEVPDDVPPTHAATDEDARLDKAFRRAKEVIDLRKRREDSLGADLFAEPAWDILLDLYVRRIEGRQTSSTSASIASRVPTTTALRYIAALHDRDLIVRTVADHDHRVHYVRLSDDAFQRMTGLLAQ